MAIYFPFRFTEFVFDYNNLSDSIKKTYPQDRIINLSEYESAFNSCSTIDDHKYIINKTIFYEFENNSSDAFYDNSYETFFKYLPRIFDVFINSYHTNNAVFYDSMEFVKYAFRKYFYGKQSTMNYKTIDMFKDAHIPFIFLINTGVIKLNMITNPKKSDSIHKYTINDVYKYCKETVNKLESDLSKLKNAINSDDIMIIKHITNNLNIIKSDMVKLNTDIKNLALKVKQKISKKIKFPNLSNQNYKLDYDQLNNKYKNSNFKYKIKNVNDIKYETSEYRKVVSEIHTNPYEFFNEAATKLALINGIAYLTVSLSAIEDIMPKCIKLQSNINNLIGTYHNIKNKPISKHENDIINLLNLNVDMQNNLDMLGSYFRNGVRPNTITDLNKVISGSGFLLQNHINKVFLLFALMLIILLVLITHFAVSELRYSINKILPISILSGIICITGMIITADQLNLKFN